MFWPTTPRCSSQHDQGKGSERGKLHTFSIPVYVAKLSKSTRLNLLVVLLILHALSLTKATASCKDVLRPFLFREAFSRKGYVNMSFSCIFTNTLMPTCSFLNIPGTVFLGAMQRVKFPKVNRETQTCGINGTSSTELNYIHSSSFWRIYFEILPWISWERQQYQANKFIYALIAAKPPAVRFLALRDNH